jgi:single-strand DNA-binding protein
MAAYFNRVLLMGNLTRDPEVRYTPKGTAVADIAIAINRVIGGEEGERREEVTYVDVTLWGRQAEIAQQYLTKGRGVFIEGRLQLDTWDDKQTGQKRSRLKVVGEHLEFLDPKPEQGPAEASAGSKPAGKRSAPAPRPQGPALPEDFDPGEVPF